MDRPGLSTVVTMNPNGSDVRWLGSIGAVTGLKYAYTLPGGASSMSCQLLTEPNQRPSAINVARKVRVYRGGSCVWEGKLAEPQQSASGWSISAVGIGALGANFQAHYTTWNADDPINQAISRGLPWINPGMSGISGLWLSQKEDDASQKISDFLGLLCTNGALTWYVDQSRTLRIIPIPTAPTRILVATDPAPRTVAADVNALYVRYQATADNTSSSSPSTAAATYGTVLAVNQASIDAHGEMEDYADLSSAGVMSSAAAQAAGQSALSKYVRATYSGPFTIRQGQWLTLGGSPIDIGAERGIPQVVQLQLIQAGYGGEVVPGPITFPVGSWEYDDTAQTATVSPLQSIASDLSSLLAAMFPAKPATDSSGG
jgi:hypothetical protein